MLCKASFTDWDDFIKQFAKPDAQQVLFFDLTHYVNIFLPSSAYFLKRALLAAVQTKQIWRLLFVK